MAVKDKGKKRMQGVMLLSVLSFALGFILIGAGIFSVVTNSDSIMSNINLVAQQDVTAAAAASMIISIIFFFIGLGLWFTRGWAKSILLIFAGLGLIYFILRGLFIASSVASSRDGITSSETIGSGITAICLVASIFILWYFTRQSVIILFEAKEMKLTKRKIRAIEEKIELGRQRCNAGEISKAELSKLRSDCIAEERLLRAKIRHFEKLRLSRERKIKEKVEGRKKAKEEKQAKKEKKLAEKEKKAEEKVGFECPDCGADVKEDETVCPKCGAEFEEEEEEKPKKKKAKGEEKEEKEEEKPKKKKPKGEEEEEEREKKSKKKSKKRKAKDEEEEEETEKKSKKKSKKRKTKDEEVEEEAEE
ncbi:MAG: hypothetical protein JSW00_16160 [Thermoplasmata archaeon]|nr:MAG: hypothetical protein JSW00_16160 [Thermoplasmata archaeon]